MLKTPDPELPQFVAARDVRRALGGIARSTLNSMIEEGMLPEPIRPRHNIVLFERGALLRAFRRMGAAA